MKRLFAVLLVLLMIFQAGCGGDAPKGEVPQNAPPAQEAGQSSGTEQDTILILQDPWAFLGGSTLTEEQTATTGIRKLTFELKPEEDVLALQYVELLQGGAYKLEKVDIVESENDTSHAYACYFNYVGEGELPALDMGENPCNLFIGIRRDEGDKTTFALIYPAGVGFADWGARADRPAAEPEFVPEPTAAPAPSPSPTPYVTTQPVSWLAQYLAPSSFLHGEMPSTYRELGNDASEQVFVLEKGLGALGRQYVNALLKGSYDLELIAVDETESQKVTFEYYYLAYTGSNATGSLTANDRSCDICVRVSNYQNRNETHIQVSVAGGFQAVDNGERADFASLNTPKPTPKPAPKPTSGPTQKPQKTGPEVIPDFLEHDISGAFRAGTSAVGNAVCFLAAGNDHFAVAEAYVQLLVDMGYRVTKTDEKVKRTWNRYQWNLYHDGVDSEAIEDDTHVRVKILSRANDGNPKTEISIGYGEGITYGGEEQYQGGGGGGSGGGGSWDPYIPDHSKLPCLDCDGTGDCDECGGYGYVGFGDARAACGRCHRSGDCRTCGGSGTR